MTNNRNYAKSHSGDPALRESPEYFNYDNIFDSGQAGMTTFGDTA